MDENSFDEILEAHLGALPFECRWCFGIDGERVGGEVIKTHFFPDLQVTHLRCPRCGGEFTSVNEGFEGGYLEERICKLYPELSAFVTQGFALARLEMCKDKPCPDLGPNEFAIADIKCIDGTEQGRMMDCLFPELSKDNPERRTILDFLLGKP